jgi:hypothetical protein
MYPCETFTADVSFSETSPAQDRWGMLSLLSHYNTADYTLRSYMWRINGSNGGPFPSSTEQTPFNGATGKYISVIKKLQLWSDTPSDPNDSSTVAYSVTVHLVPRAGYNETDTTAAKAGWPVYNNSLIKLSHQGMGQSTVWYYYRVSLIPNGTLSLSGTLENKDPVNNANLVAEVRDKNNQTLMQLFNRTVTNNSTTTLPNPAAVFTNPSSTEVRDYYLAFTSHQSARLFSANVTVQAGSYSANCNCKPGFNGTTPAWIGTRTISISNSINAEDQAAIREAVSMWNKRFLELSIPIQFQVVSTGPTDIIMYPNPDAGAAWIEELDQAGNKAGTGRGEIRIYSGGGDYALLNVGRGNLLTHVLMHELGHALDFDHMTAAGCNRRDSIMWPQAEPIGPFPGITCADCDAVLQRP